MPKTKTKGEKLLTVSQVADMLDLKETQVLYRIKTGKLEAQKIGWMWVVAQSEVERYLEEG